MGTVYNVPYFESTPTWQEVQARGLLAFMSDDPSTGLIENCYSYYGASTGSVKLVGYHYGNNNSAYGVCLASDEAFECYGASVESNSLYSWGAYNAYYGGVYADVDFSGLYWFAYGGGSNPRAGQWFIDNYSSQYEGVAALKNAVRVIYPITYQAVNADTSTCPVEAVVGDTVTVVPSFPSGYGIVNPTTDVYVMNNGVLIPSTWSNGVLTFTMPDPS